jgi:hypothetical protein
LGGDVVVVLLVVVVDESQGEWERNKAFKEEELATQHNISVHCSCFPSLLSLLYIHIFN